MTSNMKELAAILPELGFASSTTRNIRAAINNCAKVYQSDLDRIPVYVAAFDKKWGTGRVQNFPKCFSDKAQFLTWRKLVRQALARVFGIQKPSMLPSESERILATIGQNKGRGKAFGWNVDISVGVVLRVLAEAGFAVKGIDQAAMDRVSSELENNRRKTFRNGIDGLNRLIAMRENFPDLLDVLPELPLPVPQRLRPEKSAWRRSARHPATAMIWQEFDAILAKKQMGDDDVVVAGAPKKFRENSVEAYQNTLSWFLRELAAEDALEAGADLRETLTATNLILAVNHWIGDRKSRGLSTETSTLHAHVSRLVHVATKYLGVSAKEGERMRKLRRKPSIRTASVGKMSTRREEWIREFDRDEAKQALAHRLPEVLMRRADAVFTRVDRGVKSRPSERMEALRMGIAALQVAILFRASPIRATNLRELRMRGDGAELNVHGMLEDDWRLKELRLSIPGTKVKNGAVIDQIADDDLSPVLRWYLREIRPRLINDHPYKKNHVDSDYLFPSTSSGPQDRSSFNDHFRRGCAVVGFDMEMHQARHASGYWILLDDPNAWVQVAAVLCDNELTVRKFYGWLDERRASEAGREKIRQSRKSGNKHKRGGYHDDT